MNARSLVLAFSAIGFITLRADPVPDSPTAAEIVQKSAAVYAALSSYSSKGETDSEIGGVTQVGTTFNIRLQRPNLYRIDWRTGFNFGSAWSDGTADFVDYMRGPQKKDNREQALSDGTSVSGSSVGTIPGTFFAQSWANAFPPGQTFQRQPDDEAVGVECYVVTTQITPPSGGIVTQTLWIGQDDNLIHQSRQEMQIPNQPGVPFTNAQVDFALRTQNVILLPVTEDQMRAQLEASLNQALPDKPFTIAVSTQQQEHISTDKTFVASEFNRPE